MQSTILGSTRKSRFIAVFLIITICIFLNAINLFNTKFSPVDNLPLPNFQQDYLGGETDPFDGVSAPDIQDYPTIPSELPNRPVNDAADRVHTSSFSEPSIDDSELMLVHQSWMEYPYPLSFERAPRLLDPRHPKDIKVLFVNYHPGVENEVHAVFEKILSPLNLKATYNHTRGVGGLADYQVTDEKAREWWPSNRDHCDSSQYDLIVVGDITAYSRPYLTAACKTNIILYITNRFDFGVPGENEYAQLVATASKWPNVRVIVNNLYEQRYAVATRHADLHVYAYSPSTGALDDTASELLKESELDWSAIDQQELLVVGRDHEMRFVQLMQEAGIPPPHVIPRAYGGPLALTRRRLVHIPYQVNTMSLFENLNVGVLYILPSLRLYESWLRRDLFWLDGGEPNKRWTYEELLSYVDWYRTDLQFLFFYFDDLADLAPDSEFRKMVAREAEAKSQAVGQFMKNHTNRSIDAWKQALESFPRLADSSPVRRPANSQQPMPPKANLPNQV